jgi:hypothetical protein
VRAGGLSDSQSLPRKRIHCSPHRAFLFVGSSGSRSRGYGVLSIRPFISKGLELFHRNFGNSIQIHRCTQLVNRRRHVPYPLKIHSRLGYVFQKATSQSCVRCCFIAPCKTNRALFCNVGTLLLFFRTVVEFPENDSRAVFAFADLRACFLPLPVRAPFIARVSLFCVAACSMRTLTPRYGLRLTAFNGIDSACHGISYLPVPSSMAEQVDIGLLI